MFNWKKQSYKPSKQSTLYDKQETKSVEREVPFKAFNQIKDPKDQFQAFLNFQLINDKEIFITGPFKLFDEDLKKMIKLNGGRYNAGSNDCLIQLKRGWLVDRANMDQLIENIESNKQEIKVRRIPPFVFKALNSLSDTLIYNNDDFNPIQICYDQIGDEKIEEVLEPKIIDKLYEFQKQGVQFGVQQKGRLLIGDEMGVGKTIQALCLGQIYRDEWPMLIVCPSSLRFNWQDEALKWVSSIEACHVQIILNSKQSLSLNSKIVIVSYDLAVKFVQKLQKMKIIICDEAHYLKNPQSKRAESLIPLCAKAKHVILLTGTPAFAKPKELYSLLTIIRPDIFNRFTDYGRRYCDPQPNRFTRRIEYEGSDNLIELNYILKQHIMIRRLKKDVLQQLPNKIRQKIHIDGDKQIMKQIDEQLKGFKDIDKAVQKYLNEPYQENDQGQQQPQGDNHQMLTELYKLSGIAKIKGIINYLTELLDNAHIKIIVFAHHRAVLDGIEGSIKKQVGYMRIDGRVSAQDRHENVRRFQTDPTSANMGLTLTASSTVLFAEMHWTPALMQQAEDRAHRIGQTSESVHICYLVNEKTLDRQLYSMILKKIGLVSQILEGKKSKEMDNIQQVYKNTNHNKQGEGEGEEKEKENIEMDWLKDKEKHEQQQQQQLVHRNSTGQKSSLKDYFQCKSIDKKEKTANFERLLYITQKLNEQLQRSNKSE